MKDWKNIAILTKYLSKLFAMSEGLVIGSILTVRAFWNA